LRGPVFPRWELDPFARHASWWDGGMVASSCFSYPEPEGLLASRCSHAIDPCSRGTIVFSQRVWLLLPKPTNCATKNQTSERWLSLGTDPVKMLRLLSIPRPATTLSGCEDRYEAAAFSGQCPFSGAFAALGLFKSPEAGEESLHRRRAFTSLNFTSLTGWSASAALTGKSDTTASRPAVQVRTANEGNQKQYLNNRAE